MTYDMSHSEHRVFPTRRRRFEVSIRPSLVAELVLVMWSALGGDDKLATHDLGRRWFEGIKNRISPEMADRMSAFGGDTGKVWYWFLEWAMSAPDPGDTEAALEWMAGSDFTPFKERALQEMCWELDSDDIAAALDGDPGAVDQCVDKAEPGCRNGIERWLTFPTDQLPGEVVAVIRYLIEEVVAEEAKRWSDAYTHSAAAVDGLTRILEPADLIERVTNGIDYQIPLGIVRLVLVPSVSLRPWAMTVEMGDTVFCFYPVLDAHLEADPGAPAQWLVRYHKALGDARRLRMLRRLAEGPARLADLTEEVGLAKSTVFHHISVLRGAGLIRVHVANKAESGGPVYTLRRGVFATAADGIETYLNPSDPESSGDEQ